MTIKINIFALLLLSLIGCDPPIERQNFEYWSQDGSNGFFLDGNRLSIGSVIYTGGKPIEKGVEGKLQLNRAENYSAICLTAKSFAMALPKPRGIRDRQAFCGSTRFVISRCLDNDGCSGWLIRTVGGRSVMASPKWYSYETDRGVTKISFDSRGLTFNTLIIKGERGPHAPGT